MKYMVMECHPGYAVVLSDDGNFLKVANMHYEVGQTVADVIEMQYPLPEKKKKSRWIYTIAATAACLALIITSVLTGVLILMSPNTPSFGLLIVTSGILANCSSA